MLAKTKIKLLVIERDVEIRNLVKKHLLDFNDEIFRIVEAIDGLEAMQKLKNEEFNLIVSELNPERKNTVELCHFLKSLDLKREPQILITAENISPDDLNQLKTVGQKNVIMKPLDQKTFLTKALQLLKTR